MVAQPLTFASPHAAEAAWYAVIVGVLTSAATFLGQPAPQGVVDAFPFSTARAMHTNLLVLWLLLGFMGATFYVVPEEAERELAWPRLAIAQQPVRFWMLIAVVHGLMVLAGVVVTVRHLLTLRPAAAVAPAPAS